MPVFIAAALVLTVSQPRLKPWLARHEFHLEGNGGIFLPLAIYLTGV